MLRTIIAFGAGIFLGVYLHAGISNSTSVQSTHNSSGEKIVVIAVETERDAYIAAGRECASSYTVIGEGFEDNKVVLTVGCPEEKKKDWF